MGVWIEHAVLNKVLKVELTEKVILEQSPVGSKGAGCPGNSIPGR